MQQHECHSQRHAGRSDLADRYATDPAYRLSLITTKAHDAGRRD
jgi:hypothetical protein